MVFLCQRVKVKETSGDCKRGKNGAKDAGGEPEEGAGMERRVREKLRRGNSIDDEVMDKDWGGHARSEDWDEDPHTGSFVKLLQIKILHLLFLFARTTFFLDNAREVHACYGQFESCSYR